MFSYYGSKSKLVKRYPVPQQDTIIEPFAGSARYALLYSDTSDRQVWLNDICPTIYNIWKYLQQASHQDIDNLPDLQPGDDIRNFTTLSQVEKDLLGFACGVAVAIPQHRYTGWSAEADRCRRLKVAVKKHLDRIRHWKITCLDYKDMENVRGTWFVDPPYQSQGYYYPFHSIDYKALGCWCQERNGEVVVCEQSPADWLPFTSLLKTSGNQKRREREELIYYHSPVTSIP